jgi:hypothetical protein
MTRSISDADSFLPFRKLTQRWYPFRSTGRYPIQPSLASAPAQHKTSRPSVYW